MKKHLFCLAVLLAAGCFSLAAQEVRYQGEAAVGFGLGTGGFEANRFELETVHGVTITPYFFVGGGVGLHCYFKKVGDEGGDLRVMPFFVDVKGYLFDRKVSPFVSFDAGYATTIAGALNWDGFYCSPSLGVRIRSFRYTALSFSVGFQSQKLSTEYRHLSASTKLHGVAFRLGFLF